MMVTEIVEQTCKVSNMHMHVEAWLLYVQELQHLHFLFVNAVQNVIGLTGRNQTTENSIDITITINLVITNNVDIRGTATPDDDSSHSVEVTIPGPITTPELRVPFSGLRAGTNYTFEIEAVSRNDGLICIGVGISNLFLQTDHRTCPSGELILVA